MTGDRSRIRRALVAWLLLSFVAVAPRHLGWDGRFATVPYWMVIVLLPLWLTRGDSLGLSPLGMHRSLLLALILGLTTLPPFVAVGAAIGEAPSWSSGGMAAAFGRQLLVAGLPEEFFFRGYLQGQWAAARGTRTVRILGANLGWEWPAAAAAFSLTHVLQIGPWGGLTLFPGLVFGWAFARTGTIWAGALYHAACNAIAVPYWDAWLH